MNNRLAHTSFLRLRLRFAEDIRFQLANGGSRGRRAASVEGRP